MSESISNLVALTLQHGRYESKRTVDAAECRQPIREWEPQLAFIDLDIYEIVARPYALMRRVHRIEVPLVPKIRLDGLEVDLIEQRVRVGGKDLSLTPIQQSLLYLLAANAGEVLSREELLTSIWGGEFEIESNVVDRHIRELRVKLGDDWRTPQFIETVAGQGYRFKSQAIPDVGSEAAK